MDHLTCKKCGYKQYDSDTIRLYRRRFPEMELHDIPYECAACRDPFDSESCAFCYRTAEVFRTIDGKLTPLCSVCNHIYKEVKE